VKKKEKSLMKMRYELRRKEQINKLKYISLLPSSIQFLDEDEEEGTEEGEEEEKAKDELELLCF